MKGVILAGGKGTRLAPLTNVLNKHLLPVYNKPMIYYPLSILIAIGVKEILLTTHEKEMPFFKELLGDGSHLGIKIIYKIQAEAGGIAEVLLLADDFINQDERFVMCLGDNIFDISNIQDTLYPLIELKEGAGVVLCEIKDPERFGVATVDENNKVLSVVEKPQKPQSNLAITGLYFYDRMAIDFAKKICRSARGELEITDVNNEYLKMEKLTSITLSSGSVWLDTGTMESLREASEYIRITELKKRKLISSPEEIALNMNFITKEELLKLINNKKGEYYEYLKKLCK
jgi:glucose-1-phosphate thymidylyltransferase